ncbi:MAG: hypothetical protein ACKN9D_05140 [Actinomycetales bacterium]
MNTASSDEEEQSYPRPWSSRPPQRWILAAVAIVLAVAVVIAAINYITIGRGGIVPYLMLAGGPTLGAYYLWYFAIRKWD